MSEGTPELSISIVSHGQADLVERLLMDIHSRCTGERYEVILTLNIPESLPFDLHGLGLPISVIHNRHPKGFGQNHNAASLRAKGRYFCVLNPDIRLQNDPFPILISELADASVGVSGPSIVNAQGKPEDSARNFPAPLELLGKLFGGRSSINEEQWAATNEPDWLAGMFLMFPKGVFDKLGGFDESYFLYYEDVDICLRLWLAGYRVRLCRSTSAIHEARRTSRRNLKYMYWHLSSMLGFFFSASYRKIRRVSRS